MTAFTPLRTLAAFAGALSLLAACSGEQAASDGFKPVPVSPVLGDVPLGSPDAKVTVLEYASLACPHCRDFWKQDFPRLKANYIDTGKIKYIYRDLPIDNDLSITLAAVSRCKGEKAYYDLIDDIFTNQFDIEDAARQGGAAAVIVSVAAKHGLSADEVRTCIDHTPGIKQAIQKSADDAAARLKAAGQDRILTPTVFVNDEWQSEHTYEALSKVIDKKLDPNAAAAPAPAASTPAQPTSAPGQ